MTKIVPLNDKVLLERLEAEEKTAGGILLPDTAKEKPTEGRVVAVGEGRLTEKGERIPPSLKVGDRVLFGSYAGTSVKITGTEYLIIDEGEVLAVVDDAPWGGKAAKGGSKKRGKK
ncbi:MAG: co-chaperone GroES [Planctomycetota bacterium]|jgi:chaperonin GroES